ncbi:hypothetical protein DFJ74DRAFT_288621 [Hyaloraphidium curvatum]|nr:hypothetical protein DFJ74DRAFT_288621 [Hyaloraphidium curvatum]
MSSLGPMDRAKRSRDDGYATTDVHSCPSSLVDLPDELLLAILALLPLADIFELRYLCRRVLPSAKVAFISCARSISVHDGDFRLFCSEMTQVNSRREVPGERLKPFDLGRIARTAGVAGDSAMVRGISKLYFWALGELADFLRGFRPSVRDLAVLLESKEVLESKPAAEQREFLRKLNLSAPELRSLMPALFTVVDPGVRWGFLAAAETWANENQAAVNDDGRLASFLAAEVELCRRRRGDAASVIGQGAQDLSAFLKASVLMCCPISWTEKGAILSRWARHRSTGSALGIANDSFVGLNCARAAVSALASPSCSSADCMLPTFSGSWPAKSSSRCSTPNCTRTVAGFRSGTSTCVQHWG